MVRMEKKNKIVVSELPEVANVCRQILREVWKSKNMSVAHVIMRPGAISLLHKHKTFTELYYILEGKGILWVGNEKLKVRGGVAVEIPPGISHKLKNIGKKKLTHLVLSTPAFNPKDVILVKRK